MVESKDNDPAKVLVTTGFAGVETIVLVDDAVLVVIFAAGERSHS
jgi:hypothetical protein